MSTVRSKLRAPALPPQTLSRPRLLDRICSRPWKLVVLEAPAGYGKSVLAAQVLEQDPDHTAWLYVEPEDGAVHRFARYLCLALGEVVPALLNTEVIEPAASVETFNAREWTENLILFLQEFPRERLRVVLDNYESIAASKPVAEVVDRLLTHCGNRVQFLLTTRRHPGLAISALVAREEALLLNAEELAFTLDEFRRGLSIRARDTALREAEELWERCEGWCVVLGLAAASKSRKAPFSQTRDYIEEAIFQGLSADRLRDFRAAALLEVVTPAGLKAVGLSQTSLAIFTDHLNQNGIPYLALDENAGIRLHPLVRTGLLAGIHDMSPQERAVLTAKARVYYLSENRPDAAVRLALALNDPEGALHLINDNWIALEEQQLISQVELWLESLPQTFRSHPLYLLNRVRGWRVSGENRRVIEAIEAMRASGVIEESSPDYPRLWIWESWSKTILGDGDYETLHRQWLDLRDRLNPEDLVASEYMLQLASIYDLRFSATAEHTQNIWSLISEDAVVPYARNLNVQGIVHHETGSWAEAVKTFECVIQFCTRRGESGYRSFALLGKAFSCKEAGRLKTALEAVEECERVERAAGGIRLVTAAHAARTRGEIYWYLGRRTEALAQLTASYNLFKDHNRYEALATGILLDHWRMLSGEQPLVVPVDAFTGGFVVSEARVRQLIHFGRKAVLSGDYRGAVRLTTEARDLAREMPAWRASAWFTEALALNALDERERCRRALREGISILKAADALSYPMADHDLTAWVIVQATADNLSRDHAWALARGEVALDLQPAFRAALEQESEPEKLERLTTGAAALAVRGLEETLAGRRECPEKAAAAYCRTAAAAPLPALVIELFGTLKVLNPAGEVRFTRKASRRIFQILVLDHPRPVHEERILDALWPELDPGKAKRTLQTAVNELRKILDPHHRPRGDSYVLYRDEHYALHIPPGSSVDIQNFRECISVRSTADHDGERSRDAMRRALRLYRGDLLAEFLYEEHLAEPRESFRNDFLEVSAALASTVKHGSPAEAIAVLKRGLETDPFWGEGTALLMQTLQDQGRRLAAIRVYREYESRLQREMGVSPDAPLEHLFQSLTES